MVMNKKWGVIAFSVEDVGPLFMLNVIYSNFTMWRLVFMVIFKPNSLNVLIKSLRTLSASLPECVLKDPSPSSL